MAGFGFLKELSPVLDIAGAAAGLLGAEERQEDAQQWAGAEASQQRAWQEHMANTQYSRAVEDLKRAGLNPMLAYGNLHGGIPSGGMGSAGTASPGGAPNISGAVHSASAAAVNEAVEERTRAEAKKVEAETAEIQARTPTHAVNIERMRQEIGESAVRIERIWEETRHHAASAKHLEQQIVNLQETVPQIRAQVKNLEAMTGQHTATTAEIRQRIAAELPQLKAILEKLEAKSRQIAIPGQQQEADVRDSFTGLLGDYLRRLLPLNSFLGNAK